MNRTPALPMTPEQRATLHGWIRAGTTAQRVVLRSRIVVLAADGLPSKHIAHQLATSQDTVRLWRRRFAVGGPGALTRDAPGRGRKRQVTAAREQQVVEAPLHTAPPRATHWSLRTMAAAQGLSTGVDSSDLACARAAAAPRPYLQAVDGPAVSREAHRRRRALRGSARTRPWSSVSTKRAKSKRCRDRSPACR